VLSSVSRSWPCRVVRLEACDLFPVFVRSRVPCEAENDVGEFLWKACERKEGRGAGGHVDVVDLLPESFRLIYPRVAMPYIKVFDLFSGRRTADRVPFILSNERQKHTSRIIGYSTVREVLCTLHSFQMKGGGFNFFNERKVGAWASASLT